VLLRWGLPDMPFMDRVGYVFLLCCALALLVSWLQGWKPQAKAMDLANVNFTSSTGFNIGAAAVTVFLIAVYALFW
jgi:SSS family solute:Na+ symporter